MIIELAFAASMHAEPGDWNERHLSFRASEGPFFVTAFHNSEDNLSLGVGLRGEIAISKNVDLYGELLLTTGYAAADVIPGGRVGAEFYDRVSVWVIPKIETSYGTQGGVIGIEASIFRWEW